MEPATYSYRQHNMCRLSLRVVPVVVAGAEEAAAAAAAWDPALMAPPDALITA